MSDRVNIIISLIMLCVAFLGFVDASYLAYEHYRHFIPPCSVVSGCERVTTSKYSIVFGVPVALGGSLYYASIISGIILYYDMRRPSWLLKVISISTLAGFGATVWFVFLQLFVIKAICLYCMLSAFSSTTLFVCGMIFIYRWIRVPTINYFPVLYE